MQAADGGHLTEITAISDEALFALEAANDAIITESTRERAAELMRAFIDEHWPASVDLEWNQTMKKFLTKEPTLTMLMKAGSPEDFAEDQIDQIIAPRQSFGG